MQPLATSKQFKLGLTAILAIAYTLLRVIDIKLSISPLPITAVLAPSGIGLAAFLVWGKGIWPGIFFSSVLANTFVFYHLPSRPPLIIEVLALLALATGSTLQAWVGTLLINRVTGGHVFFQRSADLFRALLLAIIPCCLINAFVAVSALGLLGICPGAELLYDGYIWFSADFTGILIFTPFLLNWSKKLQKEEIQGSLLEALCLLFVTFFFIITVFLGLSPALSIQLPSNRLIFPLLLWATIRFGYRGLTLLILLLSTAAIYATAHKHGPFAHDYSVFEALSSLQWYFVIATVTGLALAAALEDRRLALSEVRELLKEKNERLATTELQLQAIISNAPIILFALDTDGTIRLSEGKGLAALGFRPGELVGKSVWPLYRDLPGAMENTMRALKGEEFFSTMDLPPNGARLTTYYAPLHNAQGSLKGTIGVSVDVTDLRKAELERQFLLEETQRQARRLKIVNDMSVLFSTALLNLQPLLDLITRAVADAFQQGCVIRLRSTETDQLEIVSFYFPNPKAMQAMEELRNIHPTSQSEDIYSRVLQEKTTIQLRTPEEIRAALSSNHTPFFDQFPLCGLIVVPMKVYDQVIGTLSVSIRKSEQIFSADDQLIIQDIADRAARAVENARLYQDAQRSARMREEFLSVSSHELRTPLTTLKMQIYLLKKLSSTGTLGNSLSPVLDKLLNESDEQISRLERLTADLLDVSRLSTGRLTLNREDVDLSVIVHETISRMKTEIQTSKCEIVIKAESPALGHWDKCRIEQVLGNMVTNALKFGRGMPVEVEVTSTPATVRLMVSDHGIGISKNDQSRIFDRFERAVSERSFSGLGLGLYITRQIVQQHGGTITVESEPGAGSRFIVELPARS